MNALAQELLVVCKRYIGLAAPAFLHRGLREIGTDANRVEAGQLESFANTARLRAEPLMGPAKAAELRTQLLECGAETRTPSGEHKLASDAAARLLDRGSAQGAVTAYRELAAKHGDVDSYRGLAAALLAAGLQDGAVKALRDGAAARLRANDRSGELQLLAEAVVVAPVDLAVHRRLAAALANHGDLPGACVEYRRFIETVLERGDERRAWIELAYARELLGDLPDLLAIADHITGRSIQPGRSAAVAARPAANLASAAKNEPIDFRKEALRRRGGSLAASPQDLEATLADLAPAGSPIEAAAIAHMRATVLIAAGDKRAAAATLEAARELLALDRPRAAADVLLTYINAGFEAREAHLVLAEAVRRLGRPDVAEQKCRLVAKLHELDGNRTAADNAELAAQAVRAAPAQRGA